MPIDPLTGEFLATEEQQRIGSPAQDVRVPTRFGQPDEEGGFQLLDLDDALLFLPRGLEKLGRSVVSLVTLGEFGEAKQGELGTDRLARAMGFENDGTDSLLGGLAEALTQFVLPFGLASKGVNAVAAAVRTTRAAKTAGDLATVGQSIFRGAAAGAVADFVAFDGHEERLSNLIERSGFGNEITNVLMAKPGDTEIEGRLKNAMEGLGVGGFFDGLLAGVKAVRASKDVKGKKALRRTAEEAVEPAVKSEKIAAKRLDEAIKEQDAVDTAVRKAAGEPEPRKVKPKGEPAREILKAAGADEEELARGEVIFQELLERNEGDLADRMGGRARTLTREQRAVIGLAESGRLNLESLFKDDPEGATLMRAFERSVADRGVKQRITRTDQETFQRMNDRVADLHNMDPDEQLSTLGQLADDIDGLEDVTLGIGVGLVALGKRRMGLAKLIQSGTNQDPTLVTRLGLSATELTPDRLRANFATSERLAMGYLVALTRVRGSAGRSLRNNRLTPAAGTPPSTDLAGAMDDLNRLNTGLGTKEMDRRIAAAAIAEDLPTMEAVAAVMKLAQARPGERFRLHVTESVIGALLHSAKTVATNGLFPFVTAFYKSFENMVGGVQGAMWGDGARAQIIMKEGRIIANMVGSFSEAAKAFGRVVKSAGTDIRIDPRGGREGITDFSSFSPESMQAAYGEAWGPGSVMGGLANLWGKFINYPGRLMRASDEFTKTFVARGILMTEMQERAIAMGVDPASYIPRMMDRLMPEGRLLTEANVERMVDIRLRDMDTTDPTILRSARDDIRAEILDGLDFDELNPITTAALERGREVTATSRPKKGSLTASTEQFIQQHPWGRLVLPFINTPSNLATFAIRRQPLAALSIPSALIRSRFGTKAPNLHARMQQNTRDLLSSDAAVRNSAYGRILTGTGLFATTLMLADRGIITGGGPEDPEQRAALTQAGWQPYSFKTADGYVQFLRADPFSITMGLAADLLETSRLVFHEDENDAFTAVGVGLISSIADNITGRTYLTGLTQMLDAATQPRRHGMKWLANTTTLLVPRSFAQLRDVMDDPVMRETHGFLNKIRRRAPFMGQAPPMRNVLGEPVRRALGYGADPETPASLWLDMVAPISYRSVTDDEVNKELAGLAHGFAPPKRTVLGLRLDDFRQPGTGQDAYDRWSELHGSVTVRGRTMKEELRKLIRSRVYSDLDPRSSAFATSPRVEAINRVIGRFRRAAWEKTLGEYPDLAAAHKSRRRDQRRLRAGESPSALLRELQPFAAFQ